MSGLLSFVSAGSDGEHLDYSNWLHRIWYPARQQAGVEWAQFHDLRRANATGLVLEGIDLKTAQTRLGHTDPRLTCPPSTGVSFPSITR